MSTNYEYLLRICEKRKSIRHFSDTPVDQSDVEKILKIAYTSPYASGRKNWELIVIDEHKQILEIAAIVKNGVKNIGKRIDDDYKSGFLQYAENFSLFETAPLLIIPSFRIAPTLSIMLNETDQSINLWDRDNFVKSISCVAMLVLLAASSLDLGGCYMTGPLIFEDEISRVIKIKNGRNIGAIIPIGHIKK